jgi:hypothetical protein
MAVERHFAAVHRADEVDVLNLFRLCGSKSPHWRRRDLLIERLNRKIDRFVVPAVSGRDITDSIVTNPAIIPPPPIGPLNLGAYKIGSSAVGLAVLSSVAEVTTITTPLSTTEFGSSFESAWQSAHLSQQVGEQVAQLGYDRIYIFGGRHCYSWPFVDETSQSATVVRYEQGATGTSYVEADTMLYQPSTHARMVEEHDFDAAAGEAFFLDRLNRDPHTDAGFFTASQTPGALPEGLRGKEYASFFTSSPDEYLAVRDELTFGEFANQQDVAVCLARSCRAAGKLLAIRFHPHLQYKHSSWTREWDFDALAAEGAVLIFPDAEYDSYALIRSSCCVFTCGSSVGFESTFLGVPNAGIGRWLTTELGASVQLENSADIAAFIKQPFLPNRAQERALRYGSFRKRGGMPLNNLDVGTHPNYARVEGRMVDPIRWIAQSVRDFVSRRPKKRGSLDPRSGMRDGKVVLALRKNN